MSKCDRHINAVAKLAAYSGSSLSLRKSAQVAAENVLSPSRKASFSERRDPQKISSQSTIGGSSQQSSSQYAKITIWKEATPINYELIKNREEKAKKSNVLVLNLQDHCLYSAKSSRNETAYMKCTESGCKVVGTISRGMFKYSISGDKHLHENHLKRVDVMKAYDKLKNNVLTSNDNIHDLYRKWLRQQVDDHIIVDLAYDKISSTLEKLRLSLYPPCKNLVELDKLLLSDPTVRQKFGVFKGMEFYQGQFEGSAMFLNETIINKIPDKTKTTWYFDSTFSILPLDFKQLLIGHVEIAGITHAVVYVLMKNSRKKNYAVIFKWLRDFFDIYAERVIVDHELAQMNAVKEVWPDAIIQTCYFHFTQAIRTNTVDKVENYKGLHQRFISAMYRKLPLLPLNFIQSGINAIIEQQDDLKVSSDFKKFNTYFVSTWMDRYKPKNWCVYGVVNRTNNICESHNSAIKRYFPHRPTVYTFLDKLQDTAHEAYAKLLTRLNDESKGVEAPKSKSEITTIINKYVPGLVKGDISVKDCLRGLANFETDTIDATA